MGSLEKLTDLKHADMFSIFSDLDMQLLLPLPHIRDSPDPWESAHFWLFKIILDFDKVGVIII